MPKEMIHKGYVMIWMPTHPRAYENGLVYKHIVVMTEKIGRALTSEEVVHHLDEDKLNNNAENLIVFRTVADHVAFHRNGIMIEMEDGTFTAARKESAKCKQCGQGFKSIGTKQQCCSHKCADILKRLQERPSKEELYSLIKTLPFTTIGKKYGVSDNAIRGWCRQYGLPSRKCDL